ncbi:MAG TPA: glycosyltransferase family 1 protein [Actinomycetota bacterium]|nr:glycosyltransferase family 1 protein [Actinomycetota bacterium]
MRVLVDGGSSGSGGYFRYLRGILAPGHVPPGTDVVLLCSPEVAGELREVDDRVRLLVEPVLSAPARHRRVAWWLWRYPRLVREVAPDAILHTSGFRRGRAGRVPSVAVHHNMAPFSRQTFRSYGASRQTLLFLRWRLRLARSFRRADGVIFHAPYTRGEVCRRVRGVKRTAIVPNAVEPRFRADAPVDRQLGPVVEILCVSSIHLFKHPWNVVEAVARLRRERSLDLRLSIVGGGEPVARARLAARIEDLRAAPWTTVAEDVPLDRMPALYRRADLFVFPSAEETWPITLLEAMAAGLPIACSDRMAMPDLLRDGGVYFDPEDPAAIAAAIRTLLTEAGLRRAVAAAAHRRAAAFTWDRSAAAVYRFVRAVAERPHG